jgi:DNA (cytosine-5)-methyltransferase 1
MLKVVELFAGIGAPRKALENLNINHKVIAFSEIDKFAEISYRAIHNDSVTPNLGDIKEISELPSCDLITYGFPCQDISIAGYGKGIKEGTRSGLLLEVERLLNIASENNKLPKYLLMENVAALVSRKHIKDFEKWLVKLEKLGYKNFYKVLNAKDYGIPQNRERIFCVSIRDDKFKYIFPGKKSLKLKLRDLMENEVDQKYYLKDIKITKFIENLGKQGYIIKDQETGALGTNIRNNLVLPCLNPEKVKIRQNGRRIKGNDEEMFTLTTQDRHGVILVGSLSGKNSQGERVYTDKMSVSLNANGGGLGAKTGLYVVGELGTGGQRGRVYGANGSICCLTSTGHKDPPKIFIDKEISYCITANESKGTTLEDYFKKKRRQLVQDNTFKIRRLTPMECFRLMGFDDEDFKKIKMAGVSDSQGYKQAGNSIVVPVLMGIFENMFMKKEKSDEYRLF